MPFLILAVLDIARLSQGIRDVAFLMPQDVHYVLQLGINVGCSRIRIIAMSLCQEANLVLRVACVRAPWMFRSLIIIGRAF